MINWWIVNKKDFPWRKTTDPYAILLAELLLRKTTAKQVESLYPVLIQKYPDTMKLAEADEIELKKLLKPLGMEHLRTVLLKKVSLEINSNFAGKVPLTNKNLVVSQELENRLQMLFSVCQNNLIYPWLIQTLLE